MKNILLPFLLTIIIINFTQAQNTSKNALGIEFGYGGGDGVFPTYIYGIDYSRTLTGKLTAYMKYKVSKGTERSSNLEGKYVLEENTSEIFKTTYGQFVFIGGGVNLKIVTTSKSFLFISVGFGYIQSKQSREEGYLNEYNERLVSSSNIQGEASGYSLGLGYKRTFLRKYFAGGSIDFFNTQSRQSRISASMYVGVYF